MQEEFYIPETHPYNISTEMYKEGYRAYQKRFVLWKNRILQLILLLLSIDFIVSAVRDSSNTLAYVLLMICLAGIFILWYTPNKARVKIIDAVAENEDIYYSCALQDNVIAIRTIPQSDDEEILQPTILNYDDDLFIEEKDEFFLVCSGNRMIYILPKKAFYDEQVLAMREHFSDELGKNFKSNF